ncbi:MAG: DUF4336 domain-containing protein [Cyanobacteria bacterium J06627_28]
MLRALVPNLWVAEQPLKYFGLEVGTRMTVIRSETGGLAVISPIVIDERLKQQLDELGQVDHIIAPNLYHHFYVAACKAHYPNAVLWAPSGLKEKKPLLPIDRLIEPDGSSLWQTISGVYIDGFRTLGAGGWDDLNEWVFFHGESRTLILTDTAFHFDSSFPWMTQLAAKVSGIYQKLSPSVLEQIATTDKKAMARSIAAVLRWDFEQVIMAHGSIIEHGGKEQFRAAYKQFLKNNF